MSLFNKQIVQRRVPRHIRTEQTESTRPGNPQETSRLGNSQDPFTQINAFRNEFTGFRVEMIEKVSDLNAKMKLLPFQTGSIVVGMIVGTATLIGAFGWNVEFKLKKKTK